MLQSQALLIVMEYVNGGTLYDFLQNQTTQLDEEIVLNFFTQMTVALSHIHSKDRVILWAYSIVLVSIPCIECIASRFKNSEFIN